MRNHFRRIFLLLSGLCALIFTSCSSNSSSSGNSGVYTIDPSLKRVISGKISDAVNNPLADVTVTLTGDTTVTTTTDADGNYFFRNLPNGNYTITPSKANYIFNPVSYINVSTDNTLSVGGKNFTANVVIVSGDVTDVVLPPGTPTSLADVAITATPTDPALPSIAATTGADGSYSLALLNGVSYVINFSKTGYAPVDYSLTPDSLNTTLETVRMLHDPAQTTGNGTASGRIVNAFDGSAAPGLTMNLRNGMNFSTGPVIATATTDATGSYIFASIPAGIYTAEINGQIVNTGGTTPVDIPTTYFTIIVVGGSTYPGQDYAVIGGLQANQYRVVLTWGLAPHDLDSHMTGPAASGDTTQTSGRFHVYYANKQYAFGPTKYVDLDLDDTSSYGPETTTLYNQIPGVYRFSVHNFSGESPLYSSGAQVKLYKGNVLKVTFHVPTRSTTANVWTVFEINGDVITPKNTMTTVSSSSDVR